MFSRDRHTSNNGNIVNLTRHSRKEPISPKVVRYCTISFSTYDTDLRVKRYAETVLQAGAAHVDAIALAGKEGGTATGTNRGVRVYYMQSRLHGEKTRFAYFSNLALFFLRASVILLRNQFKYRYSVIHVHNLPDFLVFIALVPKLMGARIILDIHDIMPELYCERYGKPIGSLLAKTLFILEKRSLKFADFVIVANDLWRDKLIKRAGILPEKSAAILNYPNLSFFEQVKTDPSRNSLKLVYPGHLSYHHGIDIAIRAFNIVHRKVPDASFDIFARTFVYEYRQKLEALIRECDLENSVTIHPAMPPEEIPKVYSDATIGVIPKRGGLFAAEAFSSKIFDFLAAGLPIVASRTTIDEYYFDDSIIQFFEQENVEDMAVKILELYRNPERRLQLVENGRKFAHKNNWEDKSSDYVDIIASLLTSKKE